MSATTPILVPSASGSLEHVPDELRAAGSTQVRAGISRAKRSVLEYRPLLEPFGRVVEAAAIPFEGRILEDWKPHNGIED